MNKLGPPASPWNAPQGLHVARTGEQGEMLVVAFDIPKHDPLGTLSPAETDVALGMLRGESNAAIAVRRGCSTRTVANQVASLFRKLGMSSRGELAAKLRPLEGLEDARASRSRSQG